MEALLIDKIIMSNRSDGGEKLQKKQVRGHDLNTLKKRKWKFDMVLGRLSEKTLKV